MATVQGNREKILSLLGQLDDGQIDKITPYVLDLIEAARKGKDLRGIDRDGFRDDLDLSDTLPDPVITVLHSIVLPNTGWYARFGETKCNRASEDIAEEIFPFTLPPGSRSLVLAHFNVYAGHEEVKVWAQENGYGVSPIEDLFAVTAHPEYMDLQREFSIIALGSSSGSGRDECVPSAAVELDGQRIMDVEYVQNSFPEDTLFLLYKVSK